MESLKLDEAASACGGIYNKNTDITNVVIDTRKITRGCLFICIKGKRFDAHQFIDEAIEKGAAAVMISEDIEPKCPYIRVEDTSKALLALSSYYRSKFDIPVVALTGSVGKTTTKEFTYLVVSAAYKSIKTIGNLNNEIGLPQTLFQIDSSTQAAVIEMGMNHFGEIRKLTAAAKPTIALITNIGVSHIENLKSRDGILKAKTEIIEGLKKGAPLILNGDDDKLITVKDENHKIYYYGINNGDFIAKNINQSECETSFVIEYFGKSQKITIPTIGVHNIYNALAAFAVGYFLDVDPSAAADALKKYEPSGMRQKIVKASGLTCIEDCYNASPDSMAAALKTLNDTSGNKKIAVLADMLELGDYSETAHLNVGKIAAENNVDYLLAYGKDARYYVASAKSSGVKETYFFDDKDKLCDKLIQIAEDGDVVLFKGSRGMALEEVIDRMYKKRGI